MRELIVSICVLLAASAWFSRPRRHLRGRAWVSLRALVPAWRFFDHAISTPQLWWRAAGSERAAHDWQPLLRPTRRSPLALLHNADENLRLAYCALLERLVDDLTERDELRGPPPEQLVSYELVVALVRRELRDRGEHVGRFQFKLTLREEELLGTGSAPADERGFAHARTADVVVSRVHDLAG